MTNFPGGIRADQIQRLATDLAACFGIATLLTVTLFGALKAGLRARAYLILGVLPILVVYGVNTNARVYSYHGMMHTSIVYRILEGGLPPKNPILWGYPQLYAWGHHAVVAALVKLLAIPPSSAFAALNVLALGVTLVFVYRIAGFLTDDRTTRILSVTMAVFATTILNRTPFTLVLQVMTGFHLEDRGVPVAEKFTNINSMPLGVMFFAILLSALLTAFTDREKVGRQVPVIALSIAGGGFFYPLTFLGQLSSGFIVWMVMLFREQRAALRPLVGVAIGVVIGCIAVLPYLLEVSTGKSTPAMTPAPTLGYFATNLANLVLTGAPIVALLFWRRDIVRRALETRRTATLALFSIAAFNALIYLGVAIPLRSHYKFESVAFMSLGLVGGLCIAGLYRERRWLAVAAMWCFFLPWSTDLSQKLRAEWRVVDDFVQQGPYLVHTDPEQAALYGWIAAHTEPEAVFFDTRLSIPVFARRQMYIGMDPPPVSADGQYARAGWNPSVAIELKQVNGYPAEVVDQRTAIAKALYDAERIPVPEQVLEELEKLSASEPVYIVARDPVMRRRLTNPHFEEVFGGKGAWVFRYIRTPG